MKKLGRLSAAAFSFASIANSSFAVEYTESAGTGIGDLIPFALGALLIICVLFIGYKMDKSSENAPTYKQEKKGKRAKSERAIEAEEREVYAEENKSDIPYEADENEYYENDNSFDYKTGLDEETEYEEDDISLFSAENNSESSFNDIDDNISYNSYEEPEDSQEPEYEEVEEPVQERHTKRYTKKKATSSVEKVEDLPELPQVPENNEYVEEEQFVEEPSGQMDIGFLNQMEQNLKKNQEERMKKAGVDASEEPKKRGRKPKKQED